MKTQTGTYIAIAGIVVAISAHFGIIIDSEMLGELFVNIAKVVSDIAIIWGIVHQSLTTKKVVGMARSFGAKI